MGDEGEENGARHQPPINVKSSTEGKIIGDSSLAGIHGQTHITFYDSPVMFMFYTCD